MFLLVLMIVVFIVRTFVKDRTAIFSTITLDDLLDAIAWVESKNNPSAIGDNGAAIGAYQIHKICVDDVNRILGRQAFVYEDRYNPEKSREMVVFYLGHYATEQRIGRLPTFKDMARIHNGGPNGWKKKSTEKYWRKIEEALKGH